jgi:hypothetical protein
VLSHDCRKVFEKDHYNVVELTVEGTVRPQSLIAIFNRGLIASWILHLPHNLAEIVVEVRNPGLKQSYIRLRGVFPINLRAEESDHLCHI